MKKPESPISIFLVDDDKMFLTSLKHTLEEKFRDKARIFTFNSGEECVNNLKANSPDIVVLDYFLDGNSPTVMNGLQVLSKIKSFSKDVAVVMLSAQDKLEVAVNSVKAGAYEYVVKSESAVVRMQNIIRNIIYNIKSVQENRMYEKWNFVMAALIILLILFDIIYYATR